MKFDSVLKNGLKEDKLEELLVANWTHFIDSSKLMAFVLQNVQAHANHFAIISSSEMKPKGVTITLSRCYWQSNGFILWAEFSVPLSTTEMAEGTMELLLAYTGSISHINTLGNIYSKN